MVENGVGVTLDKVWEPPLPAAVGLEEASRVVFLHQLLFQAQGTLIPPGVVGLAGGPLQLTVGPHVLAAAPLCPALPPGLRPQPGDLEAGQDVAGDGDQAAPGLLEAHRGHVCRRAGLCHQPATLICYRRHLI